MSRLPSIWHRGEVTQKWSVQVGGIEVDSKDDGGSAILRLASALGHAAVILERIAHIPKI